MSTENLFQPSTEKIAVVLSQPISWKSLGIPLDRRETYSNRVCNPCGSKICNLGNLCFDTQRNQKNLRKFIEGIEAEKASVMHLGRPPRGRNTPGNPGGMVQFWYFFFPAGEGSCLVFRNFDGPRGYTLGICSSFGQQFIARLFYRLMSQCDRQGEKCFTWYHGRCVKISKRRAKKLDTFVCYFCR